MKNSREAVERYLGFGANRDTCNYSLDGGKTKTRKICYRNVLGDRGYKITFMPKDRKLRHVWYVQRFVKTMASEGMYPWLCSKVNNKGQFTIKVPLASSRASHYINLCFLRDIEKQSIAVVRAVKSFLKKGNESWMTQWYYHYLTIDDRLPGHTYWGYIFHNPVRNRPLTNLLTMLWASDFIRNPDNSPNIKYASVTFKSFLRDTLRISEDRSHRVSLSELNRFNINRNLVLWPGWQDFLSGRVDLNKDNLLAYLEEFSSQ